MTHLTALTLGQLGAVPWSFHPAWFLLIAFGVPALTWLGLAWKRALDEDPHRLRRAGLRELRKLLARVGRLKGTPEPAHLYGWCQAAARTWGVRVSTPTGGQVTRSLQTLTGDDVAATAVWRELWVTTERGLYAAGGAAPADWHSRACAAAAEVRLPKRERWLPDRLAHWVPSATKLAALAVGVALGAGALGFASNTARADEAAASAPTSAPASALASPPNSAPTSTTTPAGPPLSPQAQKAAADALRAHWNDWSAHYNIAVAQIQEGNWNYAVAHAATAFLLEPTSSANRDNLRFAIQQTGSMDPTLRRLLYGPWFQQFPAVLSPAGWQRATLIDSLILASGLTAMVVALYLPERRRPLVLGGRSGIIAGGALMIVALVSFNAYGMLAHSTSGILVEGVNLSPSPTELVPEQETSPASAGSVVLPEHSFLGWRQISLGANVSGWTRESAVMPFYQTSRH